MNTYTLAVSSDSVRSVCGFHASDNSTWRSFLVPTRIDNLNFSAYSSLGRQRGHYVHSGRQVSLLSGDKCLLNLGMGRGQSAYPGFYLPIA